MSSADTSWKSRKERTQRDAATCKAANPRRVVKQAAYGNSELLEELNCIVEQFTEQQTILAASTGFKEFSKHVHAVKFDRQFTVWLRPKVDNMSRSIGAASGQEVHDFLGRCSKGFRIAVLMKDVWSASLDKTQDMRNDIEEIISVNEITRSPIVAAGNTLRSMAGRELSKEEEGKFKICFVIFVVGMLCDGRNPGDRESLNFWPALPQTDKIHIFNWASYVIESVFSACASSRMAIRMNTPYSSPAGTALFLQNSESIKQIYDKKCDQLSHQFARDVNARQLDKTRTTIKELYSRLMVGTEVLYSNSKVIEKLRDEELQPQLLELLQGQTRMWRMMQVVHQMQHTIISRADAKMLTTSPSSESQKHTLMNLITELGFLHSSLASWVDAYKNYVGNLHSWLQKWVVQPRDRSRGRKLTLSPRKHLAPPLFVLLGDWSAGMSSLPSAESCDSIKNLAADLKKMCKQLATWKRSFSGTGAEDKAAEHGRSESEAKLATLQGGLTAMFHQLSKLSDAMASLSENVKREAEIAQEAYTVGRRRAA